MQEGPEDEGLRRDEEVIAIQAGERQDVLQPFAIVSSPDGLSYPPMKIEGPEHRACAPVRASDQFVIALLYAGSI